MAAAVLAAIELGQLVQVVWVSLGASVVVTGAFALVVRESGRSAEARRNGNGSAAVMGTMDDDRPARNLSLSTGHRKY